ncbi:hypothetical protein [Clostridium sp.]|uniref:hypothetical protein n=1 Tax=Clostridium sp. TaxID=1506 RepID=UPI003463A41F
MELVVALLYFFREAFGNVTIKGVFLSGNADLFYFLSLYYFFFYFFKKETSKNKKQIFLWIVPLIIYAMIQIVFLGGVSIPKMVINIGKIVLCIGVMYLTINKASKFNIKKFLVYISLMYAASIPLALIFRNTFIWRHGDVVNKYSLSRLQLFYMEPSELGFHLAIIIIILLAMVLYEKNIKHRNIFIGAIIVNLMVLAMARPWGSIVTLLASIVFMVGVYVILNPSKKSFRIAGVFLIGIILVVGFSAAAKNSLYMRAVDTIQGKDLSNWYRVNTSVRLTNMMFNDTSGLGVGFGNLNTDLVRENYTVWGLVSVIPNSILYEIAETGILGIIGIWGLFTALMYKCFKDKSLIKWGLLSFIFLYQVFGGHFTNPLNWMIYGFIFSSFNDEKALSYNTLIKGE